MTGEIKKIDSIKNMAVFQDFRWTSSVGDGGNNTAEFKKINILYGQNYSGKTTLSRIFRALETGSISDKYSSPEFQLSFDDRSKATQNSLNSHGQVIRVFNEDFVRDNLRFFVDDEQTINSFAILGKDNTRLEKEIKKYEAELGNEENKSGLIGKLLAAEEEFKKAQEDYNVASSELREKKRDKAKRIKNNREFGDANYQLPKIKEDIKTVIKDTYSPLTDEEADKLHNLLKDESKPEIPELPSFSLRYSAIATKAKELIEKKIQASDPIQELLNDATLAMWVRTGREYHQGKRDKCAFCGSDLPQDLWEKLDNHFNQESEELRKALDELLELIKHDRLQIDNLPGIKSHRPDFYSEFTKDLDSLEERLEALSGSYVASLDSIEVQVKKRKNDIFTPLTFDEPKSVEDAFNAAWDSLEKLRNESNQFTASLDAKHSEARADLRLYEVYTFINDIRYKDARTSIDKLNMAMGKKEEAKNTAKVEVDIHRSRIDELKAQLKDESKGADRVNYYLNNSFGHQSISLKAIEENPGDASSGYRFEVTRDDKKAFHLSKGECSLIAFCYFMAKLEDIDTKGNQPIIWFDDPISSLDANHIFFVYSLINAEIIRPEKYEDNGKSKERDRFKQLFISTHNLDFLKYLKQLPGASDKKKSQYFIITRTGQVSSDITLMPQYLKNYVTEFNFLFHQIYKCAYPQIECDENHDCYYNFGNNARKFLEVFLYYKYPNAKEKDDKLRQFFGNDEQAVSLIQRISNEFSHLKIIERGVVPMRVPEMKTTAKFILQKIKEKDPDQYSALLYSIHLEEKTVEEP